MMRCAWFQQRCCCLWALVGCCTADINYTSLKSSKPTRVATIGASPNAIILFTHLRRCGGTFVEEALLKPLVNAKQHANKPFLCKEGALARHHRLHASDRYTFAQALIHTPLVWRHCPYGIHTLVEPARPYVYVTMLRQPAARMASWFAYCDRYSPNKCKTDTKLLEIQLRQSNELSRMTAFYRTRRSTASKLSRPGPPRALTTFHPDWLEFVLDDNYATRMICGGGAHEARPPLANASLSCAEAHLEHEYAFVGALERRDESLCVLAHMLGFPRFLRQNAAGAAAKLRGPTTDSRFTQLPRDFLDEFAGYMRLDNLLYASAVNILELHLTQFPQCNQQQPASTHRPELASHEASLGHEA